MKVLLQEVRLSRGLSQNDLARLAKMSPQNIQRIEQGEAKSLTFKALEQFCHVLNCQPGDILVYESDPHKEPDALFNEPYQQKQTRLNRSKPKESDDLDSLLIEQMSLFPDYLIDFKESA